MDDTFVPSGSIQWERVSLENKAVHVVAATGQVLIPTTSTCPSTKYDTLSRY